MRILVVSEGRSELAGGLLALLHRITGFPTSAFELKGIRDDLRKRVYPKGQHAPYEKLLLSWMSYGFDSGFDAVVIVADRDGDPDREAGVVAAQSSRADYVLNRRAIGLAIETFDAWMLADEVALSKVCERTVNRQKAPESLSKDDAKRIAKGFVEECGRGMGESYAGICQDLDLDVLTTRCPKGFKPFRDRVFEMAVALTAIPATPE
jgi:hypothetical protein